MTLAKGHWFSGRGAYASGGGYVGRSRFTIEMVKKLVNTYSGLRFFVTQAHRTAASLL